jgi:signal transduction histidine kinase
MSKQTSVKDNPENIANEDSKIMDNSFDDNSIKNDISEHLIKLVETNPKAAILCKSKEKNPNYLSIVYANQKFYEIFNVKESNLIGKSYDFLFDDLDVGYSSESQLEYVRLVKDVKDSRQCSIVTTLNNFKEASEKMKFKIDFIPIETSKFYSTFIFEELDSNDSEKPESHLGKDVGLLKNLERTLHNETLLREISYLIVSDTPLQEIAQNIAKALCQYLKVDRCLIHDYRNGNTSFIAEYCDSNTKPMYGGNKDEESLKILSRYINFQNHFHKKVLDKKNSLIDIESIASDNNFAPILDICKDFSIAAQVSIITSLNEKINGGLYIHQSTERSWTVDEIDLLRMVADQLSLAIDRSDSIERIMIANHELLEKTQQLKEALKEEKNMRKMQSEFVALVSHEFKTPLQIIDSTRELLVRKLKSYNIVDDSIDKSFERIKSGIQRMNGLIHSTLNLAKMESGSSKITVERQVFNLKNFILDIVDKNSNLASNKNIKVVLKIDDLPEDFNGDQKLLDHSITNIISNAIKYSKNDSTVKILAKTGERKVLIKVVDQGIGIPKEDLKNIGQKFFRAKNSLAVAGTGIGLYLTKYFIELHGGSVLIESEMNVGTSVSVILPRTPVQDQQ